MKRAAWRTLFAVPRQDSTAGLAHLPGIFLCAVFAANGFMSSEPSILTHHYRRALSVTGMAGGAAQRAGAFGRHAGGFPHPAAGRHRSAYRWRTVRGASPEAVITPGSLRYVGWMEKSTPYKRRAG
jgi:hypothetical protein